MELIKNGGKERHGRNWSEHWYSVDEKDLIGGVHIFVPLAGNSNMRHEKLLQFCNSKQDTNYKNVQTVYCISNFLMNLTVEFHLEEDATYYFLCQ